MRSHGAGANGTSHLKPGECEPQTGATVGSRLLIARGSLSQGAFAKRLGVHKNTYARWERDEREVGADALVALARLDIDIVWLLTGSGVSQPVDPAETGIDVAHKDLAQADRELSQADRNIARADRGRSQAARLDVERLRTAIETVEEALHVTDRTASPEGKAALVAAVYELFLDGEADVGKATATVLRLIRTGT